MIYTGYFAKLEEYVQAGLNPVSIAGMSPCFYEGREWKQFAPSLTTYMNYKNGIIDSFGYVSEYIPKLDLLDKGEVKRLLLSIPNLILLCYEKPGGFCHRHVLADWIEANLGIEVLEYECGQST